MVKWFFFLFSFCKKKKELRPAFYSSTRLQPILCYEFTVTLVWKLQAKLSFESFWQNICIFLIDRPLHRPLGFTIVSGKPTCYFLWNAANKFVVIFWFLSSGYKLNLMCISSRKNLGPHILFTHNFSTILTSSKKKKKEFQINHNLTVLYQNRLNSGHTLKGLTTTFQNIARGIPTNLLHVYQKIQISKPKCIY